MSHCSTNDIIMMDEAVLSSPEPIIDLPEEYVPYPPWRTLSPDRPSSLILKKRGITLDPLVINGKNGFNPGLSPKTPGILKRGRSTLASPSRKQHVTFDPDKVKGSSETVDSSYPMRKASLSIALRSPMVYVSTSFSRFSRSSEGSWRTRESSTQVVNSSNFISFHNITYTISGYKMFKKLPPKVILSNVRFVYIIISKTCYFVVLVHAYVCFLTFTSAHISF